MNVLNVNEKVTYLYPDREERSQDSEIWSRDSIQNILWQLGLPPLMSDTRRRTAILIASITGTVLILAGIGSLIVILLSLPTLLPQSLSQIAILVSITLCLVVVTILGFKSWLYARLIISPYTKIAKKHYEEIME